MFEATINWNDIEALRDIDAKTKFMRRTIARGLDAASRELAEYIVRTEYAGKFEPYFWRRTVIMMKAIRRSARFYPSTRKSVITDRLIQARRYGRPLESGGEYQQFVRPYSRRPKGGQRSWIVKGHLRMRREDARHMFERSFGANRRMIEGKVREAIDVFLTTGTVPRVSELTSAASR